jgi:hypothetical protein
VLGLAWVASTCAIAWAIFSPLDFDEPQIGLPSDQEYQLAESKSLLKPEDFVAIWNKRLLEPRPLPVDKTVNLAEDSMPEQVALPPSKLPPLIIKSILYSEKAKLAIFDSQTTTQKVRLGEGEASEGVEVLAIHATSVTIRFEGREITQSVGD